MEGPEEERAQALVGEADIVPADPDEVAPGENGESDGEIPAAAAQTGSGRTSGGSAMRNLPLRPSSSFMSSSATRYENSAIGPDLLRENVSIE